MSPERRPAKSARAAKAEKSAEPADATAVEPAALGAAARTAGRGRRSLIDFADAVEALAERTEAAAPVAERQLVTFFLEREEFGVPIDRVREVVRVPDITRVPEAPPHIRGVVNLRGRILPVVEVRSRFGLAPLEVGRRSRIVVVEAHGRVLGMLVDGAGQVLKVPEPTIVPAPPDVLSAHTDYITGVARLGARLVILLDLDHVLLLPEGPTR